jgi:succinate dehydrogenase / fumarate reductase cytochrome b subunit
MAKTGLMLCMFLLVHLAGNLLLFVGADAFNAYAYKLTHNKAILYIAELGLIAIFGTHIALAIKLTLENKAARGGVRYAVDAQAGDMSIATKSMPFSGGWILVFLILHLINFKYGGAKAVMVDGVEMLDLYTIVANHFANPFWALYYVVSMAILAAHLHHGVQSVFQTFGFNHARHNGMIKGVALAYSALIFVGFSSFPVYFFFCKG